MEQDWILSTLDILLKGFLGALGVGGGFALILWLVKKLAQEEIKHFFESERLLIAHKQKVIETMVGELHEFAKTYYMEIIRAVGGFKLYLQEGKYPHALHALVEFLLAIRKLKNEIHGFFLQNVVAERVIAHLEYRFRVHYLSVSRGGFLNLLDGSLLAESIPSGATLNEFMAKIRENQGLKEIYDRFEGWARADDKKLEALLVADTLARLFTLEINLPYEAWYGKIPSHLTKENLDLLTAEMRTLVNEKSLTQEEMEAYIRKVMTVMV